MQEMDYREEAKNGLKFRKLYGGLRDVFIPDMYTDTTSRRVLVMEWVEGKKLADVKDIYLVEVGVYCSLSQLLDYGFYHADPHPGNLLRTSDGKLAYLDFGMMGEFKQELRDGFIEACLHLVNRDFDALGKDFVTLGLLPATAQKDEVTKALTGVFQDAVSKGVRSISFGDLSGNLGRTMYKFKFQIPSYFSLVIRSLAVLEGIALSFDPNYKVLSSSYPWIARKVLTDPSPQLRSSLRTLLYKDGNFRIDRLESLLSESLRARAEQPLVEKEGDTDTDIAIKQVLTFTFAEKGAFVREIFLQEFAKGLDALGLATFDYVLSSAAPRFPFAFSLSTSSISDEDVTNLRTLRRLILLFSRFQKTENTAIKIKHVKYEHGEKLYFGEVSSVLSQVASIQEFMPILSAISELPPESQQQIIQLPIDLAGRLLSRIAARTIKRLVA